MKSRVSTPFADLPVTAVVSSSGGGAVVDTVTAATTTLSATSTVTEVPPTTASATKKPSARESILDAAEAVVIADGAAHLTLDAVAERAKVSKGGLLYHFATKELLLEAMVDRHMQRFDTIRQQALATLPPGPGRELKALILSAHSKCVEAEQRLSCGMLAAVANSPRLLEPVRAAHHRRVASFAEGETAVLPFERTAALSLAVDGICLLEMLQVSPYSADERHRILDELLRLVDEAVASAAARHASPS